FVGKRRQRGLKLGGKRIEPGVELGGIGVKARRIGGIPGGQHLGDARLHRLGIVGIEPDVAVEQGLRMAMAVPAAAAARRLEVGSGAALEGDHAWGLEQGYELGTWWQHAADGGGKRLGGGRRAEKKVGATDGPDVRGLPSHDAW